MRDRGPVCRSRALISFASSRTLRDGACEPPLLGRLGKLRHRQVTARAMPTTESSLTSGWSRMGHRGSTANGRKPHGATFRVPAVAASPGAVARGSPPPHSSSRRAGGLHCPRLTRNTGLGNGRGRARSPRTTLPASGRSARRCPRDSLGNTYGVVLGLQAATSSPQVKCRPNLWHSHTLEM